MSEVLHWPENVHFRAITESGQKFVFCPIGQICSWHPSDYDNEWCHWCQAYYQINYQVAKVKSERGMT